MIDCGSVLAWGMPRLRDLAWRRTRDPWLVLMAEVMLQQTQTERVAPRWLEFCEEYPDPAAMASASLGEVLRRWQGLGYPRRARNLHEAAGVIVTRHGGEVPDRLDDLVELAGVGPYTARAVLAFAFERDVAVVETNTARVLARTAGATLTPKRAQSIADDLVPAGEGWAWNQVLMDLGATLCRPVPRCGDCPVRASCAWNRAGRPEPDPAIGSAGVSTPQSRFEGSARQARGRVLHALANGPAPAEQFAPDIVATLLADRLVVLDAGLLRLP